MKAIENIMSNHLDEAYNPNTLSEWLKKSPIDVLSSCVSDTRVVIEVLMAVGFGIEAAVPHSLNNREIVFDTQPPMPLSQLSEKLVRHLWAVHYLVLIGYHYRQSPENRKRQESQNFEFHIDIVDDFDASAFTLEHQSLPPLSMLFAISKGFVHHTKEMAFCWQLLENPEVSEHIYFNFNKKTRPISLFKGGIIDDNQIISQIGKMGISYVNAKQNEN